MRVCKGNKRLVLVFPTLGVAIKLPVIIWASNNLKRLIKRAFGKRVSFVEELDCSFTLLLRGITDNWGEFWFYLRTRHPFVQPTYFSFFGLVNVQRPGEEIDKTNWKNLKSQLFELSLGYSGWSGSIFSGDKHHWEYPGNFCLWRGRLRILDYGQRRTQEIIIAYGSRLQEDFDPNYQYSKERILDHYKAKRPRQ